MTASTGTTDSALTVQLRVVAALVLREMRIRYGRSQFGYLWAIAEPIAFIAAFSMIFFVSDRHPPFGNSMALFFATGVLPFHLWRNIANQLAAAFQANKTLMMYPVVQPLDTILGRFILEFMTTLFVAMLVVAALILAFAVPLPQDLLGIMRGLALLSLFAFGIGLVSAVTIEFLPSWQNILRIIMTPMMLISGIFFSLESLPPGIRALLEWNPVIHGIEAIRAGYFANYRAAGLDELYLFACGLVLTLIGLAAERAFRGRAQ
jgi:capsular polysaccharide transport system permease protein